MKTKTKALALLLCLATFITCFNFPIIVTDAETTANTVTVTVNYVYDSTKSMVTQPYKAQITSGSNFNKEIEVPSVLNYSIPENVATGLTEDIKLSKSTAGDYTLKFSLENVTEDVTVTLYYVAGQAQYTVKHYYQKIDSDEYSDPIIAELTGDIDAYTKAAANNKDGFYCKGVPQKIVAADGTTVVEIYYDRYYYTVVFDVNGGINGPEPIYAKYGTSFDAGKIQTPTRAGYNFAGWSPEINGTITSNATYTAQWTPKTGNSDYTIVIWGQNANDDKYSYINSYEAWGTVGESVTWNENTKINHVHTSECLTTTCLIPEHTHTSECYSCGKTEHTHADACCSIPAHTHGTGCYDGVERAAMLGDLIIVWNPKNGQVHYSYLTRLTYIYINGTWYYYTGNTKDGNIAPLTCGKTEHTHGTGNCNTENCNNAEQHTHTEECRICGKTEHTHNSSCSALLCGIENTSEKLMGKLHPGSDLWIYEKSETIKISADGTSVLNVYFTRKEFTLQFRNANSNQNDFGTITARWGQNISAEYNAVLEKSIFSNWSESKNASSPWTNHIGVMPQRNITYYLYKNYGQRQTMIYYGQDLNGQYQRIFSVTLYGSYTVSEEDRYEFEGYTYSKGTEIGSSCSDAEFYYTRNKYELKFYNTSLNTAEKSYEVLYQKPLGEYNYTPTDRPSSVESDAIFVGWYLNPECTGERFDLTTHIMPSNNIALYAKWVNGQYTVKTYTDDKFATLYTYDGYNGIQEKIPKYDLAKEPTAPQQSGSVFVGWFYKDGDSEKPFSFTMPITKDYDLYPKFSDTEYVPYTVYYYIEGTETEVAEAMTNTSKLGESVTVKAKTGNELYETYRTGYFPQMTSTSVKITEYNQKITVYYKEAQKINYTVYYQDPDGNNLITPVQKETDHSVVTEYYVDITNYSPRNYSITKELSWDEANNTVIFVYDPAASSLTINKTGAKDTDINQTFLFEVKGSGSNNSHINITVTVHGNGSTTITDLPIGQYSVTEKQDWSWRYEVKDSSVKNVNVTAGGSTVTFENERKNNLWLDGDSFKINRFILSTED